MRNHPSTTSKCLRETERMVAMEYDKKTPFGYGLIDEKGLSGLENGENEVDCDAP